MPTASSALVQLNSRHTWNLKRGTSSLQSQPGANSCQVNSCQDFCCLHRYLVWHGMVWVLLVQQRSTDFLVPTRISFRVAAQLMFNDDVQSASQTFLVGASGHEPAGAAVFCSSVQGRDVSVCDGHLLGQCELSLKHPQGTGQKHERVVSPRRPSPLPRTGFQSVSMCLPSGCTRVSWVLSAFFDHYVIGWRSLRLQTVPGNGACHTFKVHSVQFNTFKVQFKHTSVTL